MPIIINCKECDSPIKTSPSRINRKRYYSKECQTKSRIGTKTSVETRMKMSKTHKRIENSGRFKKGSIPFTKRYPHLCARGDKHPCWKGGRTKTVNGYIWVHRPDHPQNNHGYAYEHRLVIEKNLGRYLNGNEVVHHIDGTRDNNNLKNLMVFSSNSAHIKYHKDPKLVNKEDIILNGDNTLPDNTTQIK